MDKTIFNVSGKVLQYLNQPIKQEDGSNFEWKSAVIRLESGRMVRMTTQVDLASSVDLNVVLVCELYSDAQMKPKVRIVDVEV